MKHIIWRFFQFLLLLLLLLAIYTSWRLLDRHPGYQTDL